MATHTAMRKSKSSHWASSLHSQSLIRHWSIFVSEHWSASLVHSEMTGMSSNSSHELNERSILGPSILRTDVVGNVWGCDTVIHWTVEFANGAHRKPQGPGDHGRTCPRFWKLRFPKIFHWVCCYLPSGRNCSRLTGCMATHNSQACYFLPILFSVFGVKIL